MFPDYDLVGGGAFRVIRDSDIEVEEEAEDLVRYFRSAIKRRRRGRVIRLELEDDMPDAARDRWSREGLGADDALDLGIDRLARHRRSRRARRGETGPTSNSRRSRRAFPSASASMAATASRRSEAKDIVVHHPYESFEVVVEFLKQAAADPDVVAIKQTLYRAGKQSAIIRALIDAAEAGKSVTAVVELKARFDEEQNLLWASALERAGVQVVYGFIDWKTHAKVSMVVRREGKGYRTYCHFGTGNYHPVTARIYTDLSFFTADPQLGRDVAQAVQLHHRLCRAARPRAARHLAARPARAS